MKLTKKARMCLQEALRRHLYFQIPLDGGGLYLGYPSGPRDIIRAGLMTPCVPMEHPRVRCLRWYKLTDKGASVARQILKLNENTPVFTTVELLQAFSDDEELERIDRGIRELLKEIDYEL